MKARRLMMKESEGKISGEKEREERGKRIGKDK